MMRNNFLCFLALLLLLGTLDAQAEQAVTTRGAFRCGSLLVNAAKGRDAQISMLDDVTWMFGFLSAANLYRNPGKDILDKVDGELVRDWAISYCKEHPTDTGIEAMSGLYDRLSK